MNRRYEALLVLNTQAKDENVKEMIERLESEFEKEGAKVEQVQKMDKRHFSYTAGSLESGYYVNFILNTDPSSIYACGPNSNWILTFTVSITSGSRRIKRRRQKKWQNRNDFAISATWRTSTKFFCLEMSRVILKCVTRPKAVRSVISA